MPSFAELANRIYRKILGAEKISQQDSNGIATTMDGRVAVATVETILSEAAASGETFPPEEGSIAWSSERQRQQVNLFGKPLLHLESRSARSSLSAAMGLAMAGKRASCSLWSSDLATAQDLVRRAAGQHLPLVIHAINRALPLNGESLDGSDEAIFQLANSGAFILFAQNVQQAVDYTLIARAVAEQSLLPGIVVMDGAETAFAEQQVVLPSPELIERIVGNPDSSIAVEDAAHQLLFGESRRRVPDWYNLDRPTLQGSYRDPFSFALGAISHTTFFGKQLQGILLEQLSRFTSLTGRDHRAATVHGKRKATRAVVTLGAINAQCREVADKLQREEKVSLAVVGIHAISPLPAEALTEILRGYREVVVLERSEPLMGGPAPLYSMINPLLPDNCRSGSILYGVGGLPATESDLAVACKAPLSANAVRLGVDALPRRTNPKQQVVTDILQRNYPELGQLGISQGDGNSPIQQEKREAQTPMAVRHLSREDGGHQGYHNLSRFWDQTGVLYRDGAQNQQGVDPFAAAGHTPPLTSTFNTIGHTELPLFNPESCTGCGKCWSNCPDSAIGAVSLKPSQLLEAGVRMGGADALRPHLSKLAREMSTTTTSGATAPLIQQCWDAMIKRAPLSEERRSSAEEALERLLSNIGTLMVSHTEPLFHQPERLRAQSGELLSLVINPDSCKSCGICTTLCQQEARLHEIEAPALTLTKQSDEEISRQYRDWRIWEQLPDTASTTVSDYSAVPGIGAVAATMLSRHASMAVAGGDPAEPGSGEKIILRQLLGITEYRQQPLAHQLLSEMGETHNRLLEGIREQLAVASHVEDLAALAEGLKDLSGRQLDLATLAEKTSGVEGSGVDAQQLKEWVALAESIRTEREKIGAGEHAIGRARYSLVFASGTAASWAGTFPSNPFQVPAVIGNPGEIGALASGLIEGQLEQATTAHQLLRKAKLILKNSSVAERKAVGKMSWRDLTADELQQCPPLLLIGNDTTLAAEGSGEINWILNSGLPIKVVVLAEMDLGVSETHADARSELALSALAQRNSYVAQSSIASPDHLNKTVREALHYPGPALLRIHAPSPERHGFAPSQTLDQAEQAVSGHAFPLFRYNPDAPGVFGTRISLEGNPQQEVSIAEWALHEERFSAQFEPLSADQAGAVELDEWLALEQRVQNSKSPVVTITDSETESRQFSIEPAFARRLGQLSEQWQMLQELAGQITPFTEQVRQQAEEDVAATHRVELERLNSAHQQEIQSLREQLESEITQRITDRLVTLTERHRTAPETEVAAEGDLQGNEP